MLRELLRLRTILNIQNIPYCIGRFLLCCRSHMGIGVQCEPGGEVAEHTGYSFYVNPILQGNGGEGMAEVVESDLWDAGSCQHLFEHIVYAVR